ncbi:MAG TPA: phosphoribosylformylglycinamidine cyclo-ligase [Thermoanaerobaculia bacterium]|nr:phosphoribosylformylglycinamidine cyclo-ligase [Thermoanaerobaculia bacterium]
MTSREPSSAYARAGVDIDEQERALAGIRELVRSTATRGVLGEIGGFGGLFLPDLRGMAEPVLVASADGVGTKLVVARLAGDYSTVGRDLVNHCVNDILVQGARPLFVLDYVGCGVLEAERMVELVRGVAAGCRENACALLGGETAEMPGFYPRGDYELVGFVVGVVDRAVMLGRERVRPCDVLVGLPSAGPHTNGYSLARRVLFDEKGLSLDSAFPGSPRRTMRDFLLSPHLSYLGALGGLLEHPGLHAMAHITGGGLTDNLPRVLPDGTHALVRVGSWSIPDEFLWLQEWGGISDEEMLRVFNMGIGMVLAVAPDALGSLLAALRDNGTKGMPIGTVQPGAGGVVYDLSGSESTGVVE